MRGWRYESARHALARRGIRTYHAYKNATPREILEFERLFAADPRLKMKRDKSVRDIIVLRADHLEHPSWYDEWRAFSQSARNMDTGEEFSDITIGEGYLKKKDLSALKGTVEHEIEHAVQAKKMGPLELERQHQVAEELHKEHEDATFTPPYGVHTGTEGKGFVGLGYHDYARFEQMREKGSAYKELAERHPVMAKEKALFEEAMKQGPKLRDLPDVWREEKMRQKRVGPDKMI